MIGLATCIAAAGMTSSQSNAAQSATRSLTAVKGQPNAGNPGSTGNYIIRFTDPPLASYHGGVNGIAAPPRLANRGNKINSRAAESQAYVAHLVQKQQAFVQSLQTQLGHNVPVVFSYQHAFNGMTIKMTSSEAARVSRMANVANVHRAILRELHTDSGPAWIGATSIWNGTATGGAGDYEGEGIVIGDIDTGINFTSDSFTPTGSDAYTVVNPLGAGNFLGQCDTGGVDAGSCNSKIIGAYDFVYSVVCPGNVCDPDILEEPSATDSNGHGTHTASTAAGNHTNATVQGATVAISGVAPHANLIAYDVCYTKISTNQGLCPEESSIAAANQVVADGVVDVFNFSIGGGDSPWDDPVSLAFLGAVDAGVFVSASAGNSGPTAGTVEHDEPWTMSNAALTHDRLFSDAHFDVTAPGGFPPTLVGRAGVNNGGASDTPPGTPLTTPVSGSLHVSANVTACNANGGFTGGPFTPGFIAVISRGTCSFSEKVNNATTAGAAAVLMYNNSGAAPIVMSVPGTTIPSIMIAQSDGVAVAAWVAAHPTDATGTMAKSVPPTFSHNPAFGDIMGSFSSRGPNLNSILKPDIGNPGVSILAAYMGAHDSVAFLQGTSMAAPHGTGSAALLRGLHPTWTSAEIKSALMLTAKGGVRKENGTTPADAFDTGSGRTDLTRAAISPLVMDETTLKYFQADPANGGDPSTLNIASLQNINCVGTCTFVRKVRSVATGPMTFQAFFSAAGGVTGSVSPASFSINPGQTKTLTITVDGTASAFNAFHLGSVKLAPVGPGSGTLTVSNPTVVTIPDGAYVGGFGGATQGCSDIDTSASIPAGNTITSVTAQIALTHTWVGDTVAKLRSPSSSILGVYSRPGTAETVDDGTTPGSGDSSNALAASPLSFADANADDPETMGNTIATDGVVCQNDNRCAYKSNHGAVAGLTNFAGFNGGNPAGTWTMCMGDGAGFDSGTFSWGLTIGYTGVAPDLTQALTMPLAVFVVPPAPIIGVAPTSLTASQAADTTTTQTLTISNSGGVDLNWTISSSPVPLTTGQGTDVAGNGIVSDFDTSIPAGVYSSDDFTLAAGATVTNLFFDGFSNGDLSTDVDSIDLYVYTDASGVPSGQPDDGNSSWVWHANVLPTGAGVDVTNNHIQVDLAAAGLPALTLSSGTYWLIAAPRGDLQGLANAGPRWNWFGYDGGTEVGASPAVLIDPADLFGAGATDWTNIVDLTGTPAFQGLAFTVTGTISCGAPWLSTSPSSGTTAPDSSTPVTVTFNSALLAAGTYNASICITSNDPVTPLVAVPVTLTVTTSSTDLIFRDGFDGP